MPIRRLALLLCLLCLPTPASPRQSQAPPAELTALLDRATTYVADYVKSLTSVVSEERFDQRVDTRGDRGTSSVTVTRTLVSDYLLVHVPGLSEWLPFRDVYSVDGKPIRDRSDRLLKLFVEAPAHAFSQALRIREESSRYNIGSGFRDFNVPTFALQILTKELRPGFLFRQRGRERVDDAETVIVDYEETSTPTIIVGRNDKDVPTRGRFWIEPETGRVIRTRIETRPEDGTTRIEVLFRREPRLGLLVPSRMDERRETAQDTMEGRASYTNYRRFQVSTDVEIK